MSESLEPHAPREAMEMWLGRQRSERADETVKSYYYRIKQFVEWCEEHDIGNLNDLTTRDIFDFDSKCRAQDLSQSTPNNRFGTLRLFLGVCADYNAVTETVDIPELVTSHRVNEEKLATTRAEEILDTLDTYRYGSREHALFALAWHTTMRLGVLQSHRVETRDEADRPPLFTTRGSGRMSKGAIRRIQHRHPAVSVRWRLPSRPGYGLVRGARTRS